MTENNTAVQEEVLTGKQLCTRLEISPDTLKAWRGRGLPHFKLGYRIIRYSWRSIVEWLKEHEVQATSGDGSGSDSSGAISPPSSE